jgi:hypothetical protein
MRFHDQSRYCHAERSEASLGPSRETLSAAKDDSVRSLRLMPIGADKSPVGTVNRPLRMGRVVCQCALSGPTAFLTSLHE